MADTKQPEDSVNKVFPNIFKKEGYKNEDGASQASVSHSNIFKAQLKSSKDDSPKEDGSKE